MDLSVSEMMELQRALFSRHKGKWSPMESEYGKDFLLYMVEEIGEVIAILKKKGEYCHYGRSRSTGGFPWRNGRCSYVLQRCSSAIPCDTGRDFRSIPKKT